MKRLLIALAAAVAVSTASAIITDTQLFEDSGWLDDFDVAAEDESELSAHETAPSITVPYPCGDFGSKYLSLDTGDATLWRTNTAVGNVYFDMALQFNPSASAPVLEPGDPTKILLYQNTESNLVILAGETVGGAATNYVTTKKVAPGTWARVTVSSIQGNDGYSFKVYINGEALSTGNVSSFPSLTADTTISQVGFSGSGALDNFVARTTDPNYTGEYAARIGGDTPNTCEMYSAYSEALADALASTTQDASVTIPRSNDTKSNGSASKPYRIEDAACLKALQNAVIANPAVRSLNFVQTQDIDMTGVTDFYGIGWFTSSDKYASLPPGVANKQNVFFEGVYDGDGKTISNVKVVKHNYAGIFNCISNATIKNLTVSDVAFDGTCSESGFAIVGNSYGASVLENLTSDGTWPADMNHNAAGIAVRAQHDTMITGCVNRVDISTSGKRLGGILAFSEDPLSSTDPGVRIFDCTNYGDLSSTDGSRGVAGILSRPEASSDKTTIGNCANFGALSSGSNIVGQIVGQLTSDTYTDDGGNTFLKSSEIVGDYNGNTVNGLAFAVPTTISGVDYLTTVKQADLAVGNTYTLVANVQASETPVYAFTSAGTIAFDTARGYTFAGTVQADPNYANVISVTDATSGTVTTYTAEMGTIVATVGDVKYGTLQAAITAADEGATKTVNLIGAASGAVTIPAGVTVELSNAEVNLLAGVTSLAGEGVISASAGNFNQSFYTDHAAALFAANVWQGTAAIDTVSLGEDALTYYGNAGSTVRLSNVSVSRNLGNITDQSNNVKALELAGYLRFSGLDKDTTLPCALKGNGSIEVTGGTKKLVFTGDVSEYTGSITLSSSSAQINFGGSTTSSSGSIIVENGCVVTNASAATWTANNLIVAGEMVADGTINLGSSGKLWCNTGTGVYRANTTAAAVSVASSWNSTYVIGWAGANGTAIAFDSYGNANSTIKIPSGATLQGYVQVTANNTLTNAVKELVVDGELNLSNGYDYSTVVWKKISGSGTVKFAFTPSHWIKEKILSLDGFSGSIEVSATTQLEIDQVNVARIPADGECIVPMTVTAGGTVGGDLKLLVSGSDSGTLEYKADGANGAGLYRVASSGFDGGDGATFNIPPATQAALEAVLPSGKALSDVADAASGLTYAQAYALGLMDETTGDVEDLKATIEVVGGKVKVSLDATANAAYTVTLKVYEKASLSDEWPASPKTTYTLGNEGDGFTPGSGSAPAGFYKVEVSVSNQ